MPTRYYTENGKTLKITFDTHGNEIIEAMPPGFEPPQLDERTFKHKSQMSSAERVAYGREFGFTERKTADAPSLMELED